MNKKAILILVALSAGVFFGTGLFARGSGPWTPEKQVNATVRPLLTISSAITYNFDSCPSNASSLGPQCHDGVFTSNGNVPASASSPARNASVVNGPATYPALQLPGNPIALRYDEIMPGKSFRRKPLSPSNYTLLSIVGNGTAQQSASLELVAIVGGSSLKFKLHKAFLTLMGSYDKTSAVDLKVEVFEGQNAVATKSISLNRPCLNVGYYTNQDGTGIFYPPSVQPVFRVCSYEDTKNFEDSIDISRVKGKMVRVRWTLSATRDFFNDFHTIKCGKNSRTGADIYCSSFQPAVYISIDDINFTGPPPAIAARLAESAAIVFPPDEIVTANVCGNGVGPSTIEVLRWDPSIENPTSVGTLVVSRAKDGFVDPALNRSIVAPKYALSYTCPGGQRARTDWAATSAPWIGGSTITIDHIPLPSTPTRIKITQSAIAAKSATAAKETVRLIRADGGGTIGFSPVIQGQSVTSNMYRADQSVVCAGDTAMAYVSHMLESSTVSSPEDLDYRGPKMEQGVWILMGDAAKLTGNKLSKALEILPALVPDEERLTTCSFTGSFECSRPQSEAKSAARYIVLFTPPTQIANAVAEWYANPTEALLGNLRSSEWKVWIDPIRQAFYGPSMPALSQLAASEFLSMSYGLATFDLLSMMPTDTEPRKFFPQGGIPRDLLDDWAPEIDRTWGTRLSFVANNQIEQQFLEYTNTLLITRLQSAYFRLYVPDSSSSPAVSFPSLSPRPISLNCPGPCIYLIATRGSVSGGDFAGVAKYLKRRILSWDRSLQPNQVVLVHELFGGVPISTGKEVVDFIHSIPPFKQNVFIFLGHMGHSTIYGIQEEADEVTDEFIRQDDLRIVSEGSQPGFKEAGIYMSWNQGLYVKIPRWGDTLDLREESHRSTPENVRLWNANSRTFDQFSAQAGVSRVVGASYIFLGCKSNEIAEHVLKSRVLKAKMTYGTIEGADFVTVDRASGKVIPESVSWEARRKYEGEFTLLAPAAVRYERDARGNVLPFVSSSFQSSLQIIRDIFTNRTYLGL